MINIDDLVRQRLGGGQEPERPGAWLSMRDLLDKEMPVVAASNSNRRRIIGYFTGLLLLTTASVGGYRLYNSQVIGDGGGISDAAGSTSAVSTGNSNTSIAAKASGITNRIPSGSDAVAKITGHNQSDAATQQDHSNSITGSSRRNSGSARSLTSSTADTKSETYPAGHHNAPGYAAANRQHRVVGSLAKNDGSHVNAVAGKSTRAQQTSLTSASAVATSSASARQSGHSPIDQIYASGGNSGAVPGTPVALTASGNNAGSSRNQPRPVSAKDLQATAAPTMNSAASAPQSSTPKQAGSMKRVYDTVEAIDLVARRVYDPNTQKQVFRVDTFPKRPAVIPHVTRSEEPSVATSAGPGERPERSTTTPAVRKNSGARSVKPDKAVASKSGQQRPADILPASAAEPAASATTEKAAESDLVAVSKLGASGKHFKLWDAQKVEAAVEKVKYKMAGIQMYPGLMGGINASLFTPNSLGGFQLGLTTLFALNDWWSLLAELKYIHRFNTGSTIRDDYKNVAGGTRTPTMLNGEAYMAYEWQQEDVEHYFNYDVIQTVEIPLALRYHSGRFYSQGGLNFVYTAGIAAKEVTRGKGDYIYHRELRAASNADEKFVQNDAPAIKISDFNSRMGVGYMLGCGFMCTPAVYVDFRIAQTFLDNSKTSGAKQISKDLLRTPSVQLSVGYRFSNSKK